MKGITESYTSYLHQLRLCWYLTLETLSLELWWEERTLINVPLNISIRRTKKNQRTVQYDNMTQIGDSNGIIWFKWHCLIELTIGHPIRSVSLSSGRNLVGIKWPHSPWRIRLSPVIADSVWKSSLAWMMLLPMKIGTG